VSSFDWNALQQVRELDPNIPLGVLTYTDLDLAIGFAQHIQAETIHPHFHLLTAENIKSMQQQGFKVMTWTVNESEDIAKVKSLKPDGIITDYPDRI
jgi:glycerophosphoryl diester phosphodiesterase